MLNKMEVAETAVSLLQFVPEWTQESVEHAVKTAIRVVSIADELIEAVTTPDLVKAAEKFRKPQWVMAVYELAQGKCVARIYDDGSRCVYRINEGVVYYWSEVDKQWIQFAASSSIAFQSNEKWEIVKNPEEAQS